MPLNGTNFILNTTYYIVGTNNYLLTNIWAKQMSAIVKSLKIQGGGGLGGYYTHFLLGSNWNYN